MQTASQAYKAEMKKQLRDRSYIRVTIGLINQEAQASASVPYPERYTYYSNLGMPLNNYQVEELYAACDQDYSQVDGSMYFLPRRAEDVVLNQGIVSESLLGPVELRFPLPYDIRGLTIEFGKAWPVDFRIESDQNTMEVKGNASGHFVTEEIFDNTTWLRIVPETMVNGQGRLRIHQITMGIGIYFDNHKILSATKKEHVSPIMEELPTLDFDLTVNNKDRTFDIENEDSAVNFLEIGQEIRVLYGQELENGDTEWIPGATVYLREWSADDERMSFSASDRFEDLDGTYYQGTYRPEGIILYNLAVDVLEDAGGRQPDLLAGRISPGRDSKQSASSGSVQGGPSDDRQCRKVYPVPGPERENLYEIQFYSGYGGACGCGNLLQQRGQCSGKNKEGSLCHDWTEFHRCETGSVFPPPGGWRYWPDPDRVCVRSSGRRGRPFPGKSPGGNCSGGQV